MNTTIEEKEQSESELFYRHIKHERLKSQLSTNAKIALEIRKRETTQQDAANTLGIPLTKIKQIENGTCKDIESILQYVSLMNYNLKIIV